MPIFFLIFILIPVIELAVLIKVGGQIGVLWTVLLIFLTAIVGVNILRIQGISTLMKAQSRLQSGQLPAVEMAEGFILALAGALMIVPGFITDALGFVLLIPVFRGKIASQLMQALLARNRFHSTPRHTDNQQSHESKIIEGEFRRED